MAEHQPIAISLGMAQAWFLNRIEVQFRFKLSDIQSVEEDPQLSEILIVHLKNGKKRKITLKRSA